MKNFKNLTQIIQYILFCRNNQENIIFYIYFCFGLRPSALKELIKRVSWLVLTSAAAILSFFVFHFEAASKFAMKRGKKNKKVWRIRASIPVPPACKAGALPFELIPQSCLNN